MRILRHTDKNFASAIRKLDRRSAPPAGVEEIVKGIISDVAKRGDAALIELSNRFDKAGFKTAKELRVSDAEWDAAGDAVDKVTKKAIAASRKNVIDFAKRSLRKDWSGKNAQGAEVGERYLPFQRVGIYVPGGSAPLVSTSNMTVCLAAAAGCPEIVVMTPPGPGGNGESGSSLCFEKSRSHGSLQSRWSPGHGRDVPRNQNDQAGLESLWSGELLCRRGKTAALRSRCGGSFAGAERSRDPRRQQRESAFIAADMLAQAEHGGDSIMGFVTDSEKLLNDVNAEIDRQIQTLSRQVQLKKALKEGPGWCSSRSSKTESRS
jgi:histidinol dehydrogenase